MTIPLPVGRRPGFATLAMPLLLACCGSCRSAGSNADAAESIDAGPPRDGAKLSCADMSLDCAFEFGTLFTRANGRADGTLVALLEPTDTQCMAADDDHVILQLSILGQVQRLVVAVDGVAVHTVHAPLIGPGFAEGWHDGMTLDYPRDLGVHASDFTAVTMAEAVAFLCAATEVGTPISVFAYADGDYPSSAHQIHRNDSYPDGAIVADPTAESPTYLLFSYVEQVF